MQTQISIEFDFYAHFDSLIQVGELLLAKDDVDEASALCVGDGKTTKIWCLARRRTWPVKPGTFSR